MDRELAAEALAKRHKGLKPTQAERKSLARVEKAREEEQRWAHYGSIPQKHWREMSGRQRKVIVEQAEKYGIPFGDRVIDLPRVVRAFHDFLAANHVRLADKVDAETATADPADMCRAEADRRKAVEDAAIKRINRLVLESQYIPRQDANDAIINNNHIVRGKIEEMIDSHASLLCPENPAFARQILRDWYDRLCEDMQAMTEIDLTIVAATNGRAKNPDKVNAVRKRHSGKGK